MILVLERHGEKVVPVRAVPRLTCGLIDSGLVADMLVRPETSVGYLGYMAFAYMSDPKFGHVQVAPHTLSRHLAQTPLLDRKARAKLDERDALRFLPAGVYFRVSQLRQVFDALLEDAKEQYDKCHGGNTDERFSGVEGTPWSEAALLAPIEAELIFEGFDLEPDRADVTEAESENSEEVELVRKSVERLQQMFREIGDAELCLNPLGIDMASMVSFVQDLSRRGTKEPSERAIRKALRVLNIGGVVGRKKEKSPVVTARSKVDEHLKQQGVRKSRSTRAA